MNEETNTSRTARHSELLLVPGPSSCWGWGETSCVEGRWPKVCTAAVNKLGLALTVARLGNYSTETKRTMRRL